MHFPRILATPVDALYLPMKGVEKHLVTTDVA